MSGARRQHEVMVRLNDAELARLDELRPAVTRPGRLPAEAAPRAANRRGDRRSQRGAGDPLGAGP
jgi:hypothetical protein